MKIHEYQARLLFVEYGIPVPEGDVAQTPDEALSIARKAGFPVVLKAQVLVGGRGKAGGVKVVGNDAKQVLALMEALEEHEDVQAVYANFDIPDDEIEKISAE